MAKYTFGERSNEELQGVHPKLVDLCRSVLATGIMDFSVIDGLRTVEEQRKLVARGVSKTMRSYHLPQDDGYSHAVDLAPYPLDWEKVRKGDWREISRFGVLNGIIQAKAQILGLTVTWGGDWDRDGQTLDHSFSDAPHWQIEL